MPKSTKFNRLIVAGIAAAALTPASALAQPVNDGGVVASDSGVTQDLRAPDQVDGPVVSSATPGPPTWPVNPQPIASNPASSATPSADGDGVDTGVLIALGGGALLLVAGVGVAGRKRLLVVRQRQLA